MNALPSQGGCSSSASILDFNPVSPYFPEPPRYDLDELDRLLQETAHVWVPDLYAGCGKVDGNKYRTGDPEGTPPRKGGNGGSCEIAIAGEYAGWFRDWATGESGAPRQTIQRRLGLTSKRETIEHAAALVGLEPMSGSAESVDRPDVQALRVRIKEAPPAPATPANDPHKHDGAIALALSGSVPIQGTPAADYLTGRGLPVPDCKDLSFNEDVTDQGSRMGFPAMLAVLRNSDGERTGGIHRTFLLGGGEKVKKYLGPVKGGAIHLYPMEGDGVLGIAEGIESAIAARTLYGIPTWAGGDADHIKDFQPPAGCHAVYIFRDQDEPGRKAAEALAARLREEGTLCAIVTPQGDDDFAADLMDGVKPQALPEPFASAEVTPIDTRAALLERAAAATPDERDSIVQDLAAARLPQATTEEVLGVLARTTGVTKGALQKDHRNAVRAQRSESDLDMNRFLLADNGMPAPCLANAAELLRQKAIPVAWDEFGKHVVCRGPVPWNRDTADRPFTDIDDVKLNEWMDRAGVRVQLNVVRQAVTSVAAENAFHPVRDYLDTVAWDGVPRLTTWLETYFGVEPTTADQERYVRAVSRAWMISAVARAFRPGCKADHALVLEGPQGVGKSTGLSALGGEWYTDDLPPVTNKDAAIQLEGQWIVEIAELAGVLGGPSSDEVKAFISRQQDRYRTPYGVRAENHPRQCVFAGTYNPRDGYLKDPTGNRRWWPVRCGMVDVEGIARDRAQLWAEAVAAYKAGEPWWFDDDEVIAAAKDEQAARAEEDSWKDGVAEWLAGAQAQHYRDNGVTLHQVMRDALGVTGRDQSKAAQARVKAALVALGWVNKTIVQPATGERAKRWVPST